MTQLAAVNAKPGAHHGSESDSAGFTIIEVLIVLAVAALIIIIVLLAVPALQRSQRNQARKTDAKNLLAAVNDFTGSNGGVLPASQANINTLVSNVKFGYYTTTSNIYYNPSTTTPSATIGTTSAANTVTTEDINVYFNFVCANGQTGVPTAGTSRQFAIVYALEQNGNSGLLQCISN